MCGCGRRNSASRRPAVRPGIGVSALSGQQTAGASPAQIRALGIQSTTTPKTAKQLDADRRRIEKIRRDAIRKAFNK